jgi:hypothetical protein
MRSNIIVSPMRELDRPDIFVVRGYASQYHLTFHTNRIKSIAEVPYFP